MSRTLQQIVEQLTADLDEADAENLVACAVPAPDLRLLLDAAAQTLVTDRQEP